MDAKIDEPKAKPAVLRLRMKDWLRINNGIQAVYRLSTVLPLAVSLRLSILRRSLEPKVEEYQRAYGKAVAGMGLKDGQVLTAEQQQELEKVLTPLWEEVFEEHFVPLAAGEMGDAALPAAVVDAMLDLFDRE